MSHTTTHHVVTVAPGHPTHAPVHHTSHAATHAAAGGHGSTSHSNAHAVEIATLFVSVGLLVGVFARWIITRYSINLPYTVVLLVLGVLLAAIPSGPHLGNVGLAVESAKNINPTLLLGTLIPALIFESAFATHYHTVAKEFVQCLVLAGPGVVINTALTGAFCKLVFPYHWSWPESLLFGAIISATDPVAVVALLRDLGASKRLATLIEGESLLNDGTAFVAYRVLLQFVSGANPSGGQVFVQFLRLTFGGVGTGILCGLVVQWWLRHVYNDEKIEITITILSAYLCFHIGEVEVQGSGVLSVVFLGLVCSKYKSAISPSIEKSMEHVWESLSYVANTIIFLLAGIIIITSIQNGDTLKGSDAGWLIVIYLGIHVTRAITIAVLWPLMYKCGYGLSWKEGVVLWYGGLRGAIGLALALLTKLDQLGNPAEDIRERRFKDLVLFHTSGIVFLTLLVNATTVKYIVSYFHMDRPNDKQARLLIDTMKYLRARTEVEIRAMKEDPKFSGSDWRSVVDELPNYAEIIDPDLKNRKKGFMERICGCCTRTWEILSFQRQDYNLSSQRGDTFYQTASVQLLTPQALHNSMDISDVGSESGRESSVSEFSSGNRIVRMDSGRFGLLDQSSFNLQRWVTSEAKSSDYDEYILNHRVITVMKNSYWTSYEEGLISRSSVVILMDAAESGLDFNDLNAQIHKIRNQFGIPGTLKTWFETGNCHFYARYTLTSLLLRAMEVGQQFILAVDKVKHVLDEEIGEIGNNDRVQFVLGTLSDQSKQVQALTSELEILYPELTRAIQTRQAAQHIIHLEQRTAAHMHEEGLIDDAEYHKMQNLISRSISRLARKSFSTIEVNSEDVLLNLPFMSEPTLTKSLKKMVLRAEKRLVERGKPVWAGGSAATGAIVISRGTAEMMIAGKVIDTYSTGSFLGFDFLAGRHNHTSDCVARTTLEYFHIDGSVLKSLCRNKEVEASLWRTCATMLIRGFFMDDLGFHEQIQVGRACAVAEYHRAKGGESAQFGCTALLLTGGAISPQQRAPFIAPTVLPDIGLPYTFDKKAKLLLFNREVHSGEDKDNVMTKFRKQSNLKSRTMTALTPRMNVPSVVSDHDSEATYDSEMVTRGNGFQFGHDQDDEEKNDFADFAEGLNRHSQDVAAKKVVPPGFEPEDSETVGADADGEDSVSLEVGRKQGDV